MAKGPEAGSGRSPTAVIPAVTVAALALLVLAGRAVSARERRDPIPRPGGVRQPNELPIVRSQPSRTPDALAVRLPTVGGGIRVRIDPVPERCELLLVGRVNGVERAIAVAPDFTGQGAVEFYGIAAGQYVGALAQGDDTTADFPVRVAVNAMSVVDVPATLRRRSVGLTLTHGGESVQEAATVWAVHPGVALPHRWTGTALRLRGPLAEVDRAVIRFASVDQGRRVLLGGAAGILRSATTVALEVPRGPGRLVLEPGPLGDADSRRNYTIGSASTAIPFAALAADVRAVYEPTAPVHSIVRGTLDAHGASLSIDGVRDGRYMVGIAADSDDGVYLWREQDVAGQPTVRLGLEAPEVVAGAIVCTQLPGPGVVEERFSGALERIRAADPARAQWPGRIKRDVVFAGGCASRLDACGTTDATGSATLELGRFEPLRLAPRAGGVKSEATTWSVVVRRPLCGSAPDVVYEARGDDTSALELGIPGAVDGTVEATVHDTAGGGHWKLRGWVHQGAVLAPGGWQWRDSEDLTTTDMSPNGNSVDGGAVRSNHVRTRNSPEGPPPHTVPANFVTEPYEAKGGFRVVTVRDGQDAWSATVVVAAGDVPAPPPAQEACDLRGDQVLAAIGLGTRGLDGATLHVLDLRTGEDGHVRPREPLHRPAPISAPCEVHVHGRDLAGVGWLGAGAESAARAGQATVLIRPSPLPSVVVLLTPSALLCIQTSSSEWRSFSVLAPCAIGIGRSAVDGSDAAAVRAPVRLTVLPGDVVTVAPQE